MKALSIKVFFISSKLSMSKLEKASGADLIKIIRNGDFRNVDCGPAAAWDGDTGGGHQTIFLSAKYFVIDISKYFLPRDNSAWRS